MDQHVIENNSCMLLMTSPQLQFLKTVTAGKRPIPSWSERSLCVGMQPVPHSRILLDNNLTKKFHSFYWTPAGNMAHTSWACYLKEWVDGDHMTSESNKQETP